ncbi:segregation/condensation protein A [Listeria ivanovii]|uniref:Segregation and condensation protein A n=3 Tax=Listeria ivanovii TaxID=1638 RepID=G2ZCN8_LISIP|nr:segregation/condensation protein A [Listeria ivanovii]AHI56464.1 segregation and condensation protein A [Listeria ivanovii WSLC3009]AIS65887.1 segregation and condensation protein A [Listeria ivanovii subsp. ivanovii]MBC1759077.1 segregation/condensation protein A [Listeria ivanovii]MBK3914101.1 segregation/condensation protein A [Listeria ivanovii subsp. ivanovii]MBK3921061.1 segregation/condensation protein A [Listeria ivanovii subsp. ivanovii]
MVEMNFKVDAFEGPLDLLLHLIGQLEVDIYDIPMAEITDQYMEFVHTMQEMELDVASEYLVMAATLLAIKSKMLLPKQELEIDYDTLEEEEDPRDALVEKLMEYKRFKEAAKELKEKEAERSFYFSKPPMDLAEYDDGTNVAELDVSLNDMLSAFNKMLRRKKLNKPLHTRITTQEISIDDRMDSVMEKLQRKQNHRLRFDELFEEQTKEQLVVTFLALLELMKRKLVEVEQVESFADLYVLGKGEEKL